MASSCLSGGPALNSDISGVGVRISFYLQALFLGLLSARSGSIDEISGALYTLMATNTAMAVTGLILGLKPAPEIGFQDAVVVIYLLSMSWIIVMASLASCNRLSDDTKILQLASVIQSYAILAFGVTVLATADTFGKGFECNPNAVAVIFRPFSALKSGRIFGGIVVGLAFVCYTVMTGRDYTAQVLKKIREIKKAREKPEASGPSAPGQETSPVNFVYPVAKQEMPRDPRAPQRQATFYGAAPRPLVDGRLLFMLIFIVVFWALFLLNTELVIRWNQSTQNNSAGLNWQFGQILPLFLTVLPLINMISVYRRFGIKPTKQVYQRVKVSIIYDVDFDKRNGMAMP